MKKVLIIAYDFPPNKSIGGARPESWYRHFSQFGIEPFVVTRKWELPLEKDIDTVRSTSSGVLIEESCVRVPFYPRLRDRLFASEKQNKLKVVLRKLLTLLYKLFDFIFLPPVYRAMQREANKLVKLEGIDCILVTGEPFILFKIAKNVARRNSIPWIADYRDCWTSQRITDNLGGLDRFLMKNYLSKFEKNIVSKAKIITTPAPSYAKDLKLIFPKKDIKVVYNGYFEEKVSTEILTKSQQCKKLTIAYIGILYPHQRLELFLDGLNKALIDSDKSIKVVFYGLDFYPEQRKRVEAFKLNGNVSIEFTPKIPYADLIGELKESNICLLLSKKGADWLNTKIFDYLLANREILLVENDFGILEEIINQTETGYALSNSEEVEKYIKEKLIEFEKQGLISPPKKAKGFSRLDQSLKMSELILSLK